MIALSVFDMAKGIAAVVLHNPQAVAPDVAPFVESTFVVDRNVVELARPDQVLLMAGRGVSGRSGAVWACLCQGTPEPLAKRPGDYCGIGFWMTDAVPEGARIFANLTVALRAFDRLMRASSLDTWSCSGSR